MFSPKYRIWTGTTALLLLTVFAGCKSSGNKVESRPPPTPLASPSKTVRPPTTPPTLPPDSADSMVPNVLAWDAVEKEYQAKHGDLSAPFVFNLTNVSSGPVIIYDTSTSCDCTVAKLPSKPWTIPSGGTGEIQASIDLHKKSGTVTNQIIVFTSEGNRSLRVKALVPGPY